MAEAAAEKPCREPSGGEAGELKEFGDQEQGALRGSELFLDREVRRACGVRHQAAQRAIRVAGSEVRFEAGRRKGDGRAPNGLGDEIQSACGCTQNCTHSWYETVRVGTKAGAGSLGRDVPILLNKTTQYDVV